MKADVKSWIQDGRLQVQVDLKGDLPGHPFRGNQWSVGGGSRSEEDVKQAVGKLDALPSAEEGYKHFDDNVDQIRTLSFGFAGVGALYAPPKKVFEKHGVEMELNPSEVRYAQISVTREGVKRKLEGNDPQAEEFGATGLPEVVLDGGGYILQNGFHRATAEVLLTGKFRATVVERAGKNKYKKPVA